MQDELKLKNQLCFPLYALSRQITNLYRPLLERLGLTYPQYLVLMVLWENKSITVKQLGESLWLDSGTLTPLLKRMETNGLLIRKRSIEDERVVNISITDKGEGIKKMVEHIPAKLKGQLQMADQQLTNLRKQICNILLTIKNKG